jgi:hypothetical protein
VAQVPDWLADAYFKPQYAMLFHRDRPIPDFIGHFEHFDRDWKRLARKYGVPHLGAQECSHGARLALFNTDKAVVELVATLYRHDLQHLEYEGEYQELLCNSCGPAQ